MIDVDKLVALRREAASEEQVFHALRKEAPREPILKEQVKFWQSRLKAINHLIFIETKLVGAIPPEPAELAPHFSQVRFLAEG